MSASTLAASDAADWSSTGLDRHAPAEGIERAGHRRHRRPLIGDDAVGRPGRIAGGIDGARQPFAHAAGVAVLLALDAGHQRADARRQPVVEQRLQRLARLVPVARLDGADGDRDRRLGMVGREAREMAHAVEPVARAVAGPGIGVGGGEIGMRRKAPGLEQHARGARRVAARGQHAAGDGGGRHQVGRQPVRLLRQLQRLVGVGILQRLGLGRQQHGAAAGGGRLVDEVLAPRDGQRVERALPVLGAALQIEQRLDRPVELGIELQRALGELARGFLLALALGLQEQAAQAELLGLGRGQHGLEDAPRGGAVAADLGGLRAQQVRQRLVRQRLARLAGVADGERPVAGADGDDAARSARRARASGGGDRDSGPRSPGCARAGAGSTTPQGERRCAIARMMSARNTLVSAT